MTDRQKLSDEISRLEKELGSQHFRGLFDQKAQHKKENRLKKLRRELAELEGTLVTQQPFRKPDVEEAPVPERKPKDVKVPAAAPVPKAARPVKATTSVGKPATKPAAKTAGKAKAPAAKKKTASKPAAKPAPRKKTK